MRGWGSRLPWKLKYPSASPGKYSGSAQMGSCVNLAYKYIVLHYPSLYWTLHYLIFSDKQNGRNEIFIKCFYTESSCRGMYLSLPNLKIILFWFAKFLVFYSIFSNCCEFPWSLSQSQDLVVWKVGQLLRSFWRPFLLVLFSQPSLETGHGL